MTNRTDKRLQKSTEHELSGLTGRNVQFPGLSTRNAGAVRWNASIVLMPLLFFALASASSEQASHEPCPSLALHSGSNGWLSARCCTYPQELLLQLERGAEVHEIEIGARGELVPRSVEVHLSKDNPLGDQHFEHACTLEMQRSGSTTARGTRRAKHKMLLFCSGQVKLLINDPLVTGPSNPYKQVSLATVDIWGYEDVLPKKPRSPLDLGEHQDEIAAVLMELGVPLSLVPVDEDSSRLATSDLGTKALVKELREKEDALLRAKRFGDAQRLQEHVQQLCEMGQELHELLQQKEEALATRRSGGEIKKLFDRVSELEGRRLHLAALYDTDWWLSAMSLASTIPVSDSPKDTDEAATTELGLGTAQRELCLSDQTPKSARNLSDFDRTQAASKFAGEALSTARSQP